MGNRNCKSKKYFMDKNIKTHQQNKKEKIQNLARAGH